MPDPTWLIAVALAYLSGSVPYALLIGLARGVDIREHGSKNVGATNLGRTLGRAYGMAAFALDALKGALPVLAAGGWFGLLGETDTAPSTSWCWLGVMAAAVIGHVWPVWLGFRGGKGVATGFGAVLALWPFLTLPALAAFATWALTLGVWRIVSVSSVLAALSLPAHVLVQALWRGWPIRLVAPYLIVTGAVAGLIVFRHRSNLRRLRRGLEERLGEPDRADSTADS